MTRIPKFRVELVKENTKLYDVDKTVSSSSSAPRAIKELYNIGSWHNEKFGMICLDAQNKIIGSHIIFEGTLAETAIYVREIAVRALLNNAMSVILFHNHPGGSLQASHGDIKVTAECKKALDILQIKLLDHFILTEDDYTSMAEKGMI